MPPITPAPTDLPEDAENVSSATVENPVIPVSDSDSLSDSESVDHNGYELLSQDPENLYIENDEEEYNSASDSEDAVASDVNNLNTNSVHFPASIPDVSSCGNNFSSDIPTMDEEHIETIKSVMKGITLPSSNLPQWASLVPEEEWKAALFSEMQARKTRSRSNSWETHSRSSSNNNHVDMSNEVLR